MGEIVCKHFKELTITEVYDMLALRCEVFIMEQQCHYQDPDEKDKNAYHILIYDKQTLVAYTRILPKGISYTNYASIGRVATKSTHRKSGLGRLLMKESIAQCIAVCGKPIKISAQEYLLDFYTNLGFSVCGEGYLEDEIPHLPMIMQ